MFTSKVLASTFAVLILIFSISPQVRAQENDESLPAPIVAPSDSGAYHAINQLPESIRSSRPFAREFYEFARHAGTSGVVDNNEYIEMFHEAQQDMLHAREGSMKQSFPASVSGSWTNLGLTGSDTVPSAGITTAIVFDPQHPNIMYAGGQGGVWKSVDTGANWFSLTDNLLPNLSVSSIAIDPVSPDTLYLGTGNCNSGVPPYNGSGLYLFDQSAAGSPSATLLQTPAGISFVKAIVDPSNHKIILASSFDRGALYRSTDFGSHWSPVSTNGTTGVQGLTWDIIATGSPTVLYASTTSGIFKSADDGVTWTKTTNSTNYVTNIGRSALASPTNAPTHVFALVTDAGGSSANLYMTTNAGSTWSNIPVPSDLFNQAVHAQGWYDLAIAVTPNSTSNDLSADTIYIDGVMGYVMHGSAGWTAFSDYNPIHSSVTSGYPHVDHHSFAINPLNSNIVYDGDDGGLFVNYAAGSNDFSIGGGWTLHSHGMVSNRFYHLGLDREKQNLTWAGAQDQGLWRLQKGQDPTSFPGDRLGDAMQPVISNSNSSHVYGEGPDGQIESTNSLVTQNWGPVAPSPWWNDTVAWDAPLKMSPVSHGTTPSSNILYCGRQHLWQTTDGGNSWTRLSPSFSQTPDQVSYCSAIGLPNYNANMIYAAGGGSFQLSTNFGSNWMVRTNPGYVTCIGTSWKDPKFVVISLASNNKKVEMSEDSGHTWTDVSGVTGANIPGADVNGACNVMSIAVDSTNPLTTWYAGTDFGMYLTTDAGQHWAFMGPGLFPVRDVQILPNGSVLRVGTFGRGIWEFIPGAAVELTSLSAAKGPRGAELSWYTDNEPAGARFFVQRSVDGNSFQDIGSVLGQGASGDRHDYSFADNTTQPGTYLYQIRQLNSDGSELLSNHVELHFGADGLYLSQPYPNPYILGTATSAISLDFELPSRDYVAARIFNIDGTLIRTLLDEPLAGGPHTLTWDARDIQGNLVAPGAYICSVQTANSGTVVGKIIIVRQ